MRQMVGWSLAGLMAGSVWHFAHSSAPSSSCSWDGATSADARQLEESWPSLLGSAIESVLDDDLGDPSFSSTGVTALRERGAVQVCAAAYAQLATSYGAFTGRVTAFSSWDDLAEFVSTQTLLASYGAHHTERTRRTFWENAELDIAGEETDLYCGLTSINGCEDFVLLRRSVSCVPILVEVTLGRSMGTDRDAADQLIPVSELIIASIEASAIPTLPCAPGLDKARSTEFEPAPTIPTFDRSE